MYNYWNGEEDARARGYLFTASAVYEVGDSVEDVFDKVLMATPSYECTLATEQDVMKALIAEHWDEVQQRA